MSTQAFLRARKGKRKQEEIAHFERNLEPNLFSQEQPNGPSHSRRRNPRALIQKAYEHTGPAEGGKYDFSYIAQVKDTLRQAKDLVKFLSMNPGVSPEIKAEARKIFEEADAANQ